jgi:hypothetical protein
MKTKLLILVIFLSGINIYAGTYEDPAFVITARDTTICKKVLMGISDAKLELINGATMNVNKNDILAFKSNGKYYEKREIYLNNKATGISVLMELIAQRNGLKLFCYRYSSGGITKYENNTIVSVKDPILLVIYKNNDFYLQLTKTNKPAMLDFFHVDGAIFD